MQGKHVTRQLRLITYSNIVREYSKVRIYISRAESVVTYGKSQNRTSRTVEIGFCLRSCRLTFHDHVTNKEIRERIDVATSVIDSIEAKNLDIFLRAKDEGRSLG